MIPRPNSLLLSPPPTGRPEEFAAQLPDASGGEIRSPAYYTPRPVQPPYGALAPLLPLLLVAGVFLFRRCRRMAREQALESVSSTAQPRRSTWPALRQWGGLFFGWGSKS